MISEAKSIKLIRIYSFICDQYEENLKYHCQRFSNNKNPKFTDQEIMTIYLFAIHEEQRLKLKDIHRYACDYLHTWFPNLGSYAAFCNRINRLSSAFSQLGESLLEKFRPVDCSKNQCLLDSMPIITCSGKRNSKVAKELTDKSYCASKNLWYYGLKLHALSSRRLNVLPFPEQLLITAASENDLNVFKSAWQHKRDTEFYGDKIYIDTEMMTSMNQNCNSVLYTPIKETKGLSTTMKQFDKAFNDLYSKAVSSVRQPIESLFNWLIQKTDIQNASKVRSTKGLLIHVFGKISAAYLYLIF